MTRIERNNAAAMRAGQSRWDNAEPEWDGRREDYIKSQAEKLLMGWDSDAISFMPHRGMRDFATKAGELIADKDDELIVVQMVVALLNRDTDLAQTLASRFQADLEELAEQMVTTELENRA